MSWSRLLPLAAAVALGVAVLMPPQGGQGIDEGLDQDFQEAGSGPGSGAGADHCLRGGGAVLPCLSAGAIEFLEDANQRGGLEVVEGLQLIQDDGKAARTVVPIDHDPHDFRSVLDATAMFLERRSLRWDLGLIYPGLTLRVGPTLAGQGVLEFLLDPRKKVDDRSIGTGRLIMKKTLLPILLGVKLNLVTLVPIVFGILILLIKKALFISKAALLIASILGYNQHQYQQVLGGHMLNQGHFGSLGSYGAFSQGHSQGHHHIVDPLEDTLLKAHNKYRHDVPFVGSNTRDFSWTERDKKKSIR